MFAPGIQLFSTVAENFWIFHGRQDDFPTRQIIFFRKDLGQFCSRNVLGQSYCCLNVDVSTKSENFEWEIYKISKLMYP